MTPFPHRYFVKAAGSLTDDVELSASEAPTIRSASPPEFDGPGGRWSPETLLVGAAADCFILTFRAVARASKLNWQTLECEAAGTLDRVERTTRFTDIDLNARLTVPAGTDTEHAYRVLAKAEQQCLISNSLRAAVHLDAHVALLEPDTRARVA